MTGFRTIGVIGGMGPAATVDFMTKLLLAGGATRDQDHPRILVDCDPTLPDRHAAVRGAGPSLGPRLARMAEGLVGSGAEILCMPCNTAHAFERDVREAVDAPFVSIIEAAVDEAIGRTPGGRRVGVLAAQGTLEADLYGRVLALRSREAVTPTALELERFMTLVWRVKAGDTSAGVRSGMAELAAALVGRGADAVIAGCTEAPLVLSGEDFDAALIDSTAALAAAVIAAARL